MEPHAGGIPGLRPVPGTGTAVAHGAREVRAGTQFDARERCPGTVPGTGFSHFATLHGSAQRVVDCARDAFQLSAGAHSIEEARPAVGEGQEVERPVGAAASQSSPDRTRCLGRRQGTFELLRGDQQAHSLPDLPRIRSEPEHEDRNRPDEAGITEKVQQVASAA